MARAPYTQDNYSTSAVASTLDAPIAAGATSFNISPATSWSATNIWAVIDRSNNSESAANKEEHVWIQTNSAGALTGVVRGLGGVGDTDHADGAPIEVIASGVALGEMSQAVANTLGRIVAVGDILFADSTTTLDILAAVATGNVLHSGGVGVAPTWGKVVNADVDAAAAIDSTKLSFPDPELVVYTEDDTFEKADHSGLRAVVVHAVGGGGGSGGDTSTSGGEGSAGSGGGGGGYAMTVIPVGSLGTSETVTVGAAGSTASAGGESSFGTHAVASGGSGGAATGATTKGAAIGGDGGIGTTGDVLVRGDRGGPAFVDGTNLQQAGYGGGAAGPFGGGSVSTPATGNGIAASRSGVDGHQYGGGGSGPSLRESTSSSPTQQGQGAAGVVVVELLF